MAGVGRAEGRGGAGGREREGKEEGLAHSPDKPKATEQRAGLPSGKKNQRMGTVTALKTPKMTKYFHPIELIPTGVTITTAKLQAYWAPAEMAATCERTARAETSAAYIHPTCRS